MIAVKDPLHAAKLCVDIQKDLFHTHWSEDVLRLTETVYAMHQQVCGQGGGGGGGGCPHEGKIRGGFSESLSSGIPEQFLGRRERGVGAQGKGHT